MAGSATVRTPLRRVIIRFMAARVIAIRTDLVVERAGGRAGRTASSVRQKLLLAFSAGKLSGVISVEVSGPGILKYIG
jgi:hypothetical protein